MRKENKTKQVTRKDMPAKRGEKRERRRER
jgi:hypothetical protein